MRAEDVQGPSYLQLMDVEAERAQVPLGDDSRRNQALHKCHGLLFIGDRHLHGSREY